VKIALGCGFSGWLGLPQSPVFRIPKPFVIEFITRSRDLEERMQGLNDRIAELREQLGRAQARAELTELAESTLREQLERERERADQERERAEQLEAELKEVRRSWWRRFFGLD
jgi:predicted RNase H-like nuclease (RuvC/YqgF family)